MSHSGSCADRPAGSRPFADAAIGTGHDQAPGFARSARTAHLTLPFSPFGSPRFVPHMKPLSRLQSLAFTLGGLLLLVGALLPMVPSLSDFAPYVFCAGALLFGTLQLVQRYEGRNVTVRRLRRQQMLGACLLMISACLLLVTAFRLLPLRGGEWKVALAIAAVLELYTAFRLPAELGKEEKDK